jgi:hypothetical protein
MPRYQPIGILRSSSICCYDRNKIGWTNFGGNQTYEGKEMPKHQQPFITEGMLKIPTASVVAPRLVSLGIARPGTRRRHNPGMRRLAPDKVRLRKQAHPEVLQIAGKTFPLDRPVDRLRN